jgi:hypothetical protein
MTQELLETGKHIVTAITRKESKATFLPGVHVARIDYEEPSGLVAALRGQDALVITLAGQATHGDAQSRLIRAAAEAEIPWILPNEWSPDAASEALAKDLSQLWTPKRRSRELIEELNKSSWISVTTGFWYEWSLANPSAFGFDFEKKAVTLFDEGDTKISISTWPQVGRAVVALLSLPVSRDGDGETCLEDFRNRYVYVNSFTLSQNDMFDSVIRVTGTRREDWKVEKEPVKERFAKAEEQMKRGNWAAAGGWLYGRIFFPDEVGNHEKTRGLQNEALGLPKEELDEATKIGIDRAESGALKATSRKAS